LAPHNFLKKVVQKQREKKQSPFDKYIQNHYNIIMKNIKFSWDEKKAQKNINKHKISFEEAKTVFADENARLIEDPDYNVPQKSNQ